MAASVDNNMFQGTRSVVDLTNYMLMRGVTDFGDLEQFNLYESGYSFFVVMSIPEFLRQLSDKNNEYGTIIKNYAHILEFENRGLSGIENITSDPGELTNGINQLNIINKVNKPSNSTFSANYQEKLGSTITKAHELYLTGIKDPRTQVKTYHGLIGDKGMEPGYQYEVFTFLYIVCDNTLQKLERAVYIASAQATNVPLDIYNYDKGTYEFKEISVEFNGFPIMGRQISDHASKVRDKIFKNTVWMESDKLYNFDFNGNTNTNDQYLGKRIGGSKGDLGIFNAMNDSVEPSFSDVSIVGGGGGGA